MSITTNYGYEKEISTFECIDRDIKRIEDKADVSAAAIVGKVDKQDGYGLISEEKKDLIITNQSRIDCLASKLDGMASRADLERHFIDPGAHHELFDGKVDKIAGHGLISDEKLEQIEANKTDISRMYTQAEVDGLLATKANIEPAVKIPINNIINTSVISNAYGYYYKDQFNIVRIAFTTDAFANWSTSASNILLELPEGFRPSQNLVTPVLIGLNIGSSLSTSPSTWGYIFTNGKLYTPRYATVPTSIFVNFSYDAS